MTATHRLKVKEVIDFLTDLAPFLSAALTPVIAITTCWIAYQQYRTNKLKLKFDFYGKRFKVFEALMKFISEVLSSREISADAVRQFEIEVNEGVFLFQDDVNDYITSVRQKASDLTALNCRIAELAGPQSEERTKLVKQKQELRDWFFKQVTVSRTKFSRYLSIVE